MRTLLSWPRPILSEQASAEIIDFGYPQNSEIDTLKTYITTESIMSTAALVGSSRVSARFRESRRALLQAWGLESSASGLIRDSCCKMSEAEVSSAIGFAMERPCCLTDQFCLIPEQVDARVSEETVFWDPRPANIVLELSPRLMRMQETARNRRSQSANEAYPFEQWIQYVSDD